MDLPNLPEDQSETPDPTPIAPRTKLLITLGVIVLALIVVLHLTGVVGK